MDKNMNKGTNSNFPDAITKRDILHGVKKMNDAQKLNLGKEMSQAEWLSDAVDFLTLAPEELDKILSKAVSEGNSFLVIKVFRATNTEKTDLLLQCATNAEAQGKYRYALKAYEKLGKEDKVKSLKELLANDGDMKTALNDVFIPKSEEERSEEDEG